MAFLTPYALLLLIPLPIFIGIYLLRNSSPEEKEIPFKATSTKRTSLKYQKLIYFSLLIAGLFLAVIAFSRPYMGKEQIQLKTKEQAVFLLIDSSTSMLCEDVSPSRSELTRTKAAMIIKALPNYEFGLATFSENLILISPYTEDHESILDALPQCQPDPEIPTGSDIGRAVLSTLTVLSQTPESKHSVILFSDGEKHDYSMKKALTKAKNAGIKIYTIGVGTNAGATIPDLNKEDKKFRDYRDQIVYSKLESSTLRELATTSKGIYTTTTNDGIQQVINSIRSENAVSSSERTINIPNEIYSWFLVPSFLCLVASAVSRILWRPDNLPPLVTLFILISFTTQQSFAQEGKFKDLQQRYIAEGLHHRKGRELLEKDTVDQAIKELKLAAETAVGNRLAETHFAIGDAYTRKKNYPEASHHFSKALLHNTDREQSEASFNLANSLFLNTWSKLKPPPEIPFDEYIYQNLKKQHKDPKANIPFQPSDVQTAIREWNDALEYYQHTKDTLLKHEKADDNKATVQDLLDKLIKASEKAKKDAEKEEEEKQQKEEDGKDDQKEDDSQGGEKSSPKEKQPSDEKEEGNQKEKNSQENQNDQESDESENNDNAEPKGKPKKTEQSSETDQKTETQETSPQEKEDPKSRASRILRQLSDEQNSPLKRKTQHRYRSEKDW